MRLQILELLKNSENRVDTNKGLALIGALVGAVILIIATLKEYSGLEWLFPVYMLATMGQLPSKGLNDLGRLKIEKDKKPEITPGVVNDTGFMYFNEKHSNSDTKQKPTPPEPPKPHSRSVRY